ncbi:Crp/Fnr family transcriptional regulator [Stieleria varia]|uniref:Global nitrogen regulator n=1 Tax=Stieleria varia TaxID=2528005 RepID=A0A5C6B1F3_9BACT|nr:Global nitrogen regulator [Stieleria varia]
MQRTIWHLQHCDIFSELSIESLERIEPRCRARKFAARTPIYLPSEVADSVLLLTSGMAKICNLTNEGKQSILAFVEPGELFGELAVFERETREEYVETIEASTLVMIPITAMQELVEKNHRVALSLTKMIGLRRHRIERRLKNLLFLSNHDRLVHLLLDLAEQFGIHCSDGIRLRIKLAHQELANLMGSTRETVTILLGHLKDEGLIEVGRKRIVLLDATRMASQVHRKSTWDHLDGPN